MIRFRMSRINVDQFAILTDEAPKTDLSYTVNVGFKVASDINRIACVFSVDFAHKNIPIIKIGVSCEFDIHPDDWDNSIKDGILTISKNDL